MKFIIATNNQKKLKELRAILSRLGIDAVSLAEAGVSFDAEETGDTFEENSKIKAEAAMQASGLNAIADDSGLSVDALDGAPGVYSARYGGDKCDGDTARYELLLKNMENVPDGKRSARFVSVITCVFTDGRVIHARGECKGEILRAPKGEGGFGYDPIFYLPSENATMAEISSERKNVISHRARALEEIEKKLGEII